MAKQRFLCRYRSNGRDYAVPITANNAQDAKRVMQNLDWAPGCGPIGEPERVWELKQLISSWASAMIPMSVLASLRERSATRSH